jgi:hypothetical protein
MPNFKNYILAVVILLFCYSGVVKAGVLTPANDQCVDAIGVSVPSSTGGTTSGASNDMAPFCEDAGSQTAGGVWYTVTGTGNTITASTCDMATFDTKLSVWCRDCPEPLSSTCCMVHGTSGCDDPTCEATVCAMDSSCCEDPWDTVCLGLAMDSCGTLCTGGTASTCVAGNDDGAGCSNFTSRVSWCSQAGTTYRILVHGFGSQTGDFTLGVTDDGTGCTPTVVCEEGGNCEEAQVATQDAVESGGPYRNHGKLVKTAAHEANQFDITEECHNCIVSQFARGIPIEEQEVCTDTAAPTGCCLSPSVSCEEQVTEQECPSDHVWIENGVCDGGVCVCDLGFTECAAGTCVDTQSDPQNCGTCGNACGIDQHCDGGVCVCDLGFTECAAGTCVDLDNDDSNCGACGNQCDVVHDTCRSGFCQPRTPL